MEKVIAEEPKTAGPIAFGLPAPKAMSYESNFESLVKSPHEEVDTSKSAMFWIPRIS